MEDNVDHYSVLGLPSGEEGSRLTEKEISKAYKFKALELHPDKRPDDPNAHANFQKLKSSYEILKDDKARKLFDELLRVRRDQLARRSHQDAKRRRMVSDLEDRERSAFSLDPEVKQRLEEERIARKLKEEIARIHAMMQAGRSSSTDGVGNEKREAGAGPGGGGGGVGSVDKERMLKVSWEKVGREDYGAYRLREIFLEFGEVEDVVIKSSKKRGSALVVMATRDAAVAATRSVCGSLSNPLLVVPLKPMVGAPGFPSSQQSMESDHLSNLVGAGFKEYEDSILEKLQKAAAAKRQK